MPHLSLHRNLVYSLSGIVKRKGESAVQKLSRKLENE